MAGNKTVFEKHDNEFWVDVRTTPQLNSIIIRISKMRRNKWNGIQFKSLN